MHGCLMETTQVALLSPSSQFRAAMSAGLENVPGVWIRDLGNFDADTLPRLQAIRPDLAIIEASDNEAAALAALVSIQNLNDEAPHANPVHAILISRFTPGVISVFMQAVDRGNFDHILGPEERHHVPLATFLNHVVDTALTVIARRRGQTLPRLRKEIRSLGAEAAIQSVPPEPLQAIAIGSSTGGPQALLTVLPELCRQIDLPIFVVQHIQQSFTQSLAHVLNLKCEYDVIEACHDGVVAPRTMYFAPGGRHLQVVRSASGIRTRLLDDEPERGCRPSVNVLFRSAAGAYGAGLAAVILTGMGTDGTDGALVVKKHGGIVAVQDDASSVVWGMPGSVVAAKAADHVVPLQDLAARLAFLVHRRWR